MSVYVAYQNSPQGTRSVIDASATKACGNGLIDFDIKSVKLEVLTTLESSIDGGVEVGPVVSGAATWSGGLGAGRTISNTQELVLAVDALPNRSFVYAGRENIESAPIAGTLINLRDALIKAGELQNRICFKTTKDADDGNTYKIALSIEDRGGGNIALGLAPLGVSLSGETKSTTGNTLTVSFEPHVFTQQEVANVRRHGGRGRIDTGQSGIWSTPVKPSKHAGSGNDCPPGSTDPACQGTFNRKEPEI
ncbi:hypothetical protein [Ensifer adhaerens]|uniref:hypothetical protein n=1 Tax=Ensifer adhaerens TaxID=106592 RepID=UPI0011786433|nr:hypothetical protein [Ensifer adhaerens]